jgi:hypothetical protein
VSITTTSFRQQFPGYANTATFPDPMVQVWIDLSAQFVSLDRWGTELVDYGRSLWAAHHLTIQGADAATTALGGAAGGGGGVLSSKSGGGLSASYDVGSVMEQGAGFWNQTVHGREFYRLSQMMGAGPLQIGDPTTGPVQVGGWAGPIFF